MNCPRCKAAIGPLANPDGVVTCPGCGSRLMTRSAMLRSQGVARTGPARDAATKPARELPPDATLPATPAQMLALQAPEGGAAAPAASESPAPPVPAGAAADDSGATIRIAVPKKGPSGESPPAAEAPLPAEPAPGGDGLALVLRELRAVRALQERILEMLERSGPAHDDSNGEATIVAPIRVRRRKSVVLIDDDPATREAAVAELTQADVPVRAFADGNSAISAIAEEKPDVIALELGLGGATEGRDVVNMIKATMEWVDIPIVLWTREAVAGQREARQVHGADELVSKTSGAAALVARVITLFRRVH
jgi:CheY-like chemotaxis protein/predicted RNA-binding Zn-ribbon protein involved in translation (DUF1610 family)